MTDAVIARIHGREILDSRGNPTVEAEVALSNGVIARAAAPSGASTGKREAAELRDAGERYGGKGVTRAAHHIGGELSQALVGMAADDQTAIDRALIDADGSADKSRLGANALLAVSLAAKKAAAAARGMPLYKAVGDGATLPVPLMNIINGGCHSDNNLDVQEFMIAPHGFGRFADALRAGCETFYALRKMLLARGMSIGVGDEGGYAPNVNGAREALTLLMGAIERAGYIPGEHISIALDCAASEFYKDGKYHLPADDFCGDAPALVSLLETWVSDYPIISIEDGCDEDDWAGWQLLTRRLGAKTQLVGDDVFVTNPAELARGIKGGVANALLVKPNQIGTLTETLEAMRMAKRAAYQTVMSHRSGETEYADIADLAVGAGCLQIKTGAPCRGERTAKYNQLLRIADDLGDAAAYGGAVFGAAVVAAAKNNAT